MSLFAVHADLKRRMTLVERAYSRALHKWAVVGYFPARIPGCVYICIYIYLRHSRVRYIRWTTWKNDRSPRDRLSRARIRERKEISAVPLPSAALYSRSPGGSWHVRENDPAGNSVEDIQNGLCGGCASDLWCNANLSGFYSLLPLPARPPPLPLPTFASSFLRPYIRSCLFVAEKQEQGERKDEVETAAADTCRFFKKIAISRKL